MKEYGEMCDCIKSAADKEQILILMDEAIRKEGQEISEMREHIEKAQILMEKEDKSSDFYFALKDAIDNEPRLIDLHEDYIVRIKVLRKKLEDTNVC